MASRLQLDREAVAMFCRRHHVRRLALFGSVLRDAALSQAEDEIASGKAVSAADVLRELRDAK